MYSKTYYINNEIGKPKEVLIEVGISGGIPQIQILGDVSGKYIRNSKKFYFIFSNSGRKLPNNKVRVLISSVDKEIDESSLDLPIFVAVYMAINNINSDTKYVCIGNIALDGSVTATEDIYQKIYNIEHSNIFYKNTEIFLPFIDLPERSYNERSYIFIKNVSDIYNYFEGKPTSKYIHHRSTKKIDQKCWLGWSIAFALNRSVLHINHNLALGNCPASTGTEIADSLLSHLFGQNKTDIIQIRTGTDLEQLSKVLDSDENNSEDSYFKLIYKELNYRSVIDIIQKHLDKKWIIEMPPCQCGYLISKNLICTCTSRMIDLHHKAIQQIRSLIDPIIIDDSQLQQIDDRYQDLIIDTSKKGEINKLMRLNQQILLLIPSITKKRAIELARIIT